MRPIGGPLMAMVKKSISVTEQQDEKPDKYCNFSTYRVFVGA